MQNKPRKRKSIWDGVPTPQYDLGTFIIFNVDSAMTNLLSDMDYKITIFGSHKTQNFEKLHSHLKEFNFAKILVTV